jgi:hypothetical protein
MNVEILALDVNVILLLPLLIKRTLAAVPMIAVQDL